MYSNIESRRPYLGLTDSIALKLPCSSYRRTGEFILVVLMVINCRRNCAVWVNTLVVSKNSHETTMFQYKVGWEEKVAQKCVQLSFPEILEVSFTVS